MGLGEARRATGEELREAIFGRILLDGITLNSLRVLSGWQTLRI
jgi:hypothetical protein